MLFNWRKTLFLLLILTLLTGCSNDLGQYAQTTPKFILEDFFNGKVKAYGLLTNFSGDVTRRFTVDIDATWEGNIGTLNEYFVFADGEKQFRQWQITKTSDNSYSGVADDVIGHAIGEQFGAVLKWQYMMNLTVDGSSYEVSFDDTMVLIDPSHMLNIANIKKFGITVATVTISFQKL